MYHTVSTMMTVTAMAIPNMVGTTTLEMERSQFGPTKSMELHSEHVPVPPWPEGGRDRSERLNDGGRWRERKRHVTIHMSA